MKTFLGSALSVFCACAWIHAPLFGQAQPAGELSPQEQGLLEDFRRAQERFQNMSLERFRAEYAPRKEYLDSESESAFIRGDATGNGRLDLTDAICSLSYLFASRESCSSCEDVMDVDDDGAVLLTDPIRVLNYLFLSGPAPAPPFPRPGTDPSPDAFRCFAESLLDYDPFTADNVAQILERFPLSAEQAAAFDRYGFVVAKNRKFDHFFYAFQEIFTAHLPVYVSVDAILDSMHLSFVEVLRTLEEELLIDSLDSMLEKMEAGIPLDRERTAAENRLLDGVATYICTARSLLSGELAPCPRGVDDRVSENVDRVHWAWGDRSAEIDLFGAPLIEVAFIRPRGHYTRSPELEGYFRALLWIQRVGTRFTSSREHAAGSYLLSRNLIDTGAIEEWRLIQSVVETLGLLGGEDGGIDYSNALSAPGLLDLAGAAAVAGVQDLYDRDTWARFVETARKSGAGSIPITRQILTQDLKSVADFVPVAPAYRLFARNFIADSGILPSVAGDPCFFCDRSEPIPSPLDVWFVLGNRATVPLLARELERYGYHPKLAELDWLVSRYPRSVWSANAYNAWLSSLRTLNADSAPADVPSVMRTPQWDRRMLNTQLASWSHLRHDFLGYVEPSDPPSICDFPDGWVDPYPEFFHAVERLAGTTLQRFARLGLLESASGERIRDYLTDLRDHSARLAGIAEAELASRPLDDGQRNFLRALLSWDTPYGVDTCPVTLDGWYLDLLFSDAEPTFGPTVSAVYTDGWGGNLYAGVGHPNLMLLSVETDCGTKAYAGPVLSYHEFPFGWDGESRVSDQEWKELLESGEEVSRPPWTEDFVR